MKPCRPKRCCPEHLNFIYKSLESLSNFKKLSDFKKLSEIFPTDSSRVKNVL